MCNPLMITVAARVPTPGWALTTARAQRASGLMVRARLAAAAAAAAAAACLSLPLPVACCLLLVSIIECIGPQGRRGITRVPALLWTMSSCTITRMETGVHGEMGTLPLVRAC